LAVLWCSASSTIREACHLRRCAAPALSPPGRQCALPCHAPVRVKLHNAYYTPCAVAADMTKSFCEGTMRPSQRCASRIPVR
jgi:hypothetical protein